MTEKHCGLAPPAFDAGANSLFLDFDGTLVDIAPRPDAVQVPALLAPLLRRLDALTEGAVAVVSGRSLAELRAFLPGFHGVMIGSHGAESSAIAAEQDAEAAARLTALHGLVAEFAHRHDLLAEAKPHGAAIHFRARPEAGTMARAFAEGLLTRFPGLALQPAKMAWELRPAGATKDRAVAQLAGAEPFAGRRPFYLGDDTTDEPAIDWVQRAGGCGIKVGPGDSAAAHRLRDPGAVIDWLAAATDTAEV